MLSARVLLDCRQASVQADEESNRWVLDPERRAVKAWCASPVLCRAKALVVEGCPPRGTINAQPLAHLVQDRVRREAPHACSGPHLVRRAIAMLATFVNVILAPLRIAFQTDEWPATLMSVDYTCDAIHIANIFAGYLLLA